MIQSNARFGRVPIFLRLTSSKGRRVLGMHNSGRTETRSCLWRAVALLWSRRGQPPKGARPANADRVRYIGRALLSQIGPGKPAARDWPTRIVLVDAPAPNAFCWRDGTITLSTGLINTLALTGDELALVIGHEMAHGMRQHGRTQAGKNLLVGLGGALTELLFGGRAAHWAYACGHLASLRLCRNDERDADLLGMRIAADAGFNPEAAVTLWRKLAKLRLESPLPWLSTHPSSADRLRSIEANLAAVMPLYQRTRGI